MSYLILNLLFQIDCLPLDVVDVCTDSLIGQHNRFVPVHDVDFVGSTAGAQV